VVPVIVCLLNKVEYAFAVFPSVTNLQIISFFYLYHDLILMPNNKYVISGSRHSG